VAQQGRSDDRGLGVTRWSAHDVDLSRLTRRGRTARAIARFRPECRLIGLSPDPRTVNALSLSWGVESLAVEECTTTNELVRRAVETAVRHGAVAQGDIVLVLASASEHPSSAAPDVLRIVQVT
jgi:pyruvate kinase